MRRIMIYDSESGNVTLTITSLHAIESIQFSSRGDKLMYKTSSRVFVRDLVRDEQESVAQTPSAYSCVFSPDDTCFVSGNGDYVQIWTTNHTSCTTNHINWSAVSDVWLSATSLTLMKEVLRFVSKL